ncbi:polysaccharide deacetylase family protein [Trinickia violacea]|uniref:Polysaccharide deacetylase family protein n=1 Tax=Trinickia violacea TaxID=2571746 RepID=A0A4P8IWA2_9BURK|nr:polysaccharide deacetylase family protein [Trinickia violacea]QCP51763.1 polysaccharide deacetylase family protein [Trinickia violacea]
MPQRNGLLKELIASFLIASGIAWLTRVLLWRDRTAILLYHDPDPDTLDRHLTYLRTICDLVPLDALAQSSAGRPRAIITLDDGHAGNAALLPIFLKHKVRPTIFLCSRIVGRRRTHWWLHPWAEQAGIERLKRLLNSQRLNELHVGGFSQDGDDQATGLSLEQIEAMQPFVDFQSHTRFHPILTRCDIRECANEITDSKREVAALAKGACVHFSYPNGNYGAREIEFVKAAGYKTARTCDVGWNDSRTDPFRLRTIIITDDASPSWFAAQLTGIPLFLRYLRGGGWAGRFPQF